jgi:hypothetical protein
MREFNLDHLGIGVADLGLAEAQFRRLGFALTPRGFHTMPPPAPGAERPLVGTGNHCAMLRRGYLELIGITDPVYQGRLRADIARYQGIHLVAFGTADAIAAAGALRSAGIEVSELRTLERPIEDQGRADLARFRIFDFPGKALPEAHFFAIQHLTPDLLWKPSLLAHPNGAMSLESVAIAVEDPADFARRLGRILSLVPVSADGLVLTLGAGRVQIVDCAWLQANVPGKTPPFPYLAGLALHVADVGRTADVLAKNGLNYRSTPAGLMVAPSDACGAFIEFQAGHA